MRWLFAPQVTQSVRRPIMKMFYHVLQSYLTPSGIQARDIEYKDFGMSVTFYNSFGSVTVQYGIENAALKDQEIRQLANNIISLLAPRSG